MRAWTRPLAIACLCFAPCLAQAADPAPEAWSLVQVLEQAMEASERGEMRRSRYAVERAAGSVRSAEAAFDWSTGGSAGIQQVYQPATSGGFLTADVERYNVPTSTVFAERQLANGVRLRPGLVVSKTPNEFRADLARLDNRAFVQLDVPVDGSFGQPPDELRLQSARSGLAATQADSEFNRQSYLHRVVAAVWALVGARERVAISRALAERAQALAARMRSLAGAGEVAALTADEAQTRAALGRVAAERDGIELLTARLELAALLGVEPEKIRLLAVDFPAVQPGGVSERVTLDALTEQALAGRLDLRSHDVRVGQARLQARLAERDAESRLTVTVGTDRMMLLWQVPLGEARSSGARQESMAILGAAESALDDARRRARNETRAAYERLLAAAHTAELARGALEHSRQRAELVGRLVDAGRQPPAASLDAAEQLAAASRQWIEALQLHALALADLRRATGAVPSGTAGPDALARLFVTAP